MVTGYYFAMAILSFLCSCLYFRKWSRHFELCFTLIYLLIPFVNVGYLLMAVSKDVGEAVTAIKITYLGGCYLLLVVMISIFTLCKIKIYRGVYFVLTMASTAIYSCVLTIGHLDIFYKGVEIYIKNRSSYIVKDYGPVHSLFYIMIFVYLGLSVGGIIYGAATKKEVSLRNVMLITVSEISTVFAFFFGRALTGNIEWIPAAYLLDGIIYLLIVERLALYDVASVVSETLVVHGKIGFLSFDLDKNYLGANETAKLLLPDIKEVRVDRPVRSGRLKELTDKWIEDFKKDELTRDLFYENGGVIYKIKVGYLFDKMKIRGYRISIEDDTEHQQYLKTISQYNKNLRRENDEKTKIIAKMRNDL